MLRNLTPALSRTLAFATFAVAAGGLFSSPAHALSFFNFSFSNVNGPVSGNVSGTITLPDGDGTFEASAVSITSLPAGLGLNAPIDALALRIISNSFAVVGGNIDKSNTDFAGLITGSTALSLNSSLAGGSTFLDFLDAGDFGATGVLDSTSSTLTFSSPTAVPFEFDASFGLFALGGLYGVRRWIKNKKVKS